MLFQAKIETNNEEQSVMDLVWILRGLICSLEDGKTGGKLKDGEDNEIGEWHMNIEETFKF